MRFDAYRVGGISAIKFSLARQVLPLLEYCSQVWSPGRLGLIRMIEAVQRSYTSRIEGLSNLNYWDRLSELGLYTLERRRERYALIYIYKIIRGFVPNIPNDKYKILTYDSLRRGRLCRIPELNRNSLLRYQTLSENSFAIKAPRLFNSLPRDLRNLDGDIDLFKKNLDLLLCAIHDRPSLPQYNQSADGNSIIHQTAQMRAEGLYL